MHALFNRLVASLAALLLGLLLVDATGSAGRAAVAGPGEAGEQNPHVWQTSTRSVAVFKNGTGFFMREGEVTLRDGWCVAGQVPPATFGTLAIYSLDPHGLVDIVGSGPGEVVEFNGVDAPATAEAKQARLRASQHLNVQLQYRQHGAERSAAGRLLSVGPDFAVLDSDSNSFAVPIAGIYRLQMLDLPLRIHVARDAEADPPKADQPAARDRLGMAYLRKGITWIPEYTLRVLDEGEAELTLRGTLVNEAEDLVHCDVHFVVGVPHFLHTDFLAPVAVGQVIRTIGAAVAPREVQSQIMNRAAIANTPGLSNQFDGEAGVIDRPAEAAGGDVNAVLGNLPQLETAGGSDYTVYTQKDLTVRLGEKAIVTLFKRKITFSHVYRWSPPEAMQHYLVLNNDTPTAWTTGPCLAVSAERPLSEDLLRYTPRGGHAELPVTSAVNISHEKSEMEVDRQLKAHTPTDRVFFDLVTLEGKLKLRNFEPRPVDVVVSVAVPGKPTEASDDGRLAADPTQLKLLERAGTAQWRLTLEPGADKTLTYRYERYVPSH